jgi:predicted phosphodiesterase
MSAPVTRIFSDLHYLDGQSTLHRLETLVPLLQGVDHVILNGDTLDTQIPDAPAHVDELRAFFARHVPRVTFLSGNHDPYIVSDAELSLNDGRVWITHGDVLFDEVAPWSGHRTEIIRRQKRLADTTPSSNPGLIEERLRRNRIVCEGLPEPHNPFDRSLWTRALRVARVLFPPRRLLAMVNVWFVTPGLARRLARAQRPSARLVVVGHTHFPGVWSEGEGPVVINTGSFCGPFGGLFVELRGDHVQAVRIVQKNGQFHPGRTVAGFSLAP